MFELGDTSNKKVPVLSECEEEKKIQFDAFKLFFGLLKKISVFEKTLR